MWAQLSLAVVALTVSPHAWGQSAAEPLVANVMNTPEERLDQAVRLYQTGNSDKALGALADIVNDPDPFSEDLRQKARLYLGEVLYLQQNNDEARRFFEAILQRDPDFVIDPFQHPPDVCGFFETIRAYMRPSQAESASIVPPSPVPRTPASAYYGFGIYQLQHDRRRLGTIMAIGQTAMAVLSIASFGGLMEDRSWETRERRQALQTKKAIQWGSTAGFYAFWIWGTVDASRHWRANVHLQPASDGNGSAGKDAPMLHIGFTIPTR